MDILLYMRKQHFVKEIIKEIIKVNKIWSVVEEQFVAANAGVLTDAAGAEKLSDITGRDITVYAWRKKRQKLGIAKAPGRGVCKLSAAAALR